MEKRGKSEEGDLADLELCGPCKDYDGIQEQCIAFCFQCVDFLCSNCTKEHCKNKKTRDHTLVNGSDKPKNKDVIQALKTLMYCQQHPTVEISHTCREHCAYICVHCITTTHKHCRDINDIDDQTTQQICMNASLLNDLESEISISRKIIRSKKENIEILAMDGRNIEAERKQVIDSIIANLRHLENLSKANTQNIIKEQTAHLQEEVKQFESIEQEQEVNQALTNLVLKHGSTRLKTVGVDFIRNRSETFTSKIDQKCIDQEIRLKYDKNTLTVYDFGVGRISVEYRKREKRADQLESSSDELVENAAQEKLTISSTKQLSEYSESSISKLHGTVPMPTASSTKQCSTESESSTSKLTVSTVPKTRHLSFMERQLSKIATQINVRTPDDSQTCSVTGIAVLSNTLHVILDRPNSKVKIFKNDFTFVKEHCLQDNRKPIDMCGIDGKTFAVVYKDANLVDIFEVQGDYVTFKSFRTEYNVISITCTLDGDLMTICSKENTEIQLYTRDGCMKRRITKFKSQYNANVSLKQATCIYFTSKNEVLISNKDMVRAFCPGSKSSVEATENWYYKNRGQQGLKQAGCTATDSEGNIYVCGKKSKNVHQISNDTYWKNRVIMTLPAEPLSLYVDNVRDRILIGCENKDYLLIYQFL